MVSLANVLIDKNSNCYVPVDFVTNNGINLFESRTDKFPSTSRPTRGGSSAKFSVISTSPGRCDSPVEQAKMSIDELLMIWSTAFPCIYAQFKGTPTRKISSCFFPFLAWPGSSFPRLFGLRVLKFFGWKNTLLLFDVPGTVAEVGISLSCSVRFGIF